MEAKELINKNVLSNITIDDRQCVVFVEIAHTAISMERLAVKKKCESFFRTFITNAILNSISESQSVDLEKLFNEQFKDI